MSFWKSCMLWFEETNEIAFWNFQSWPAVCFCLISAPKWVWTEQMLSCKREKPQGLSKIPNFCFFSSLVQQDVANIVSWRAMLWFICENNCVCLFVMESFNLPEPSKFWFLSNLRTNVSFLERSRKKRQTQSATVWPGCRNHSPQIDLNLNSLLFILLQCSD